MKKKYSLDYSIERDVDRLRAVEQILDTLETNPNSLELEQMASYILYGKDEEGKNAVQRGETTDSNKRYSSFVRTEEKNKSLDEILENPLSDQAALRAYDEKYIYVKRKQGISRENDADIPFMQQLWERIDYLEKVLAANEGRIPFDDTMTVIKDPYRLYQLRHQLIDMRRHQYYLRDSYKPTLHFLALQQPQPQTYEWDSESFYWISLEEWKKRVTNSYTHVISKNLEDYETRDINGNVEVKWIVCQHNFDWENPLHIRALIDHYSNIYMQLYDKVNSWGRTLIFDFDRYVDMAAFSELRLYILTRKIDKATYPQIAEEIKLKYGIEYNETYLSTICAREIPRQIANAAKKHRMLLEVPITERKRCYTCKRWLPRDTLFFGINNFRYDHLSSNCKECEKKKRIAKGGQSKNDKRNKETKMLEMQTRKT